MVMRHWVAVLLFACGCSAGQGTFLEIQNVRNSDPDSDAQHAITSVKLRHCPVPGGEDGYPLFSYQMQGLVEVPLIGPDSTIPVRESRLVDLSPYALAPGADAGVFLLEEGEPGPSSGTIPGCVDVVAKEMGGDEYIARVEAVLGQTLRWELR
jgi:hypothetical protein